MAKRQFCQLAHTFVPGKHSINGQYVSLKLDGERAVWIPESRGILASRVPWANVTKDKKEVLSTGLWSRRGKVIYAPDWWIKKLPPIVVEGELWTKPGEFQTISSICRTQDGTKDWSPVRLMMFDAPPPAIILADGTIDDKPHFVKTLHGCYPWWQGVRQAMSFGPEVSAGCPFQTRLKYLADYQTDHCVLHHQEQLPLKLADAQARLNELFDKALDEGHEGLVIKNPVAPYACERSWMMLKYKPWEDMEATVVGYTTGRETDRGSRLLGKMGAVILVSDTNKRFKVGSGFTDPMRTLSGSTMTNTAEQWASQHPEEDVPDWIENSMFPRGSRITIKYRELSDDGIPKEGRYFRKRKEV